MSISAILPLVIVGEGAWLLWKLRAFYVLHPVKTMRSAFSGEKTGGAWLSLMLALAGTLGVGNILGVTVAIEIGGAGSLFWMLVSSVFSSVIKYAEVRISAAHGSRTGMIDVLKRSFGSVGGMLGRIYAVTALLLSVVMGSALQSYAAGASAAATFGYVPPTLAAILAASVILLSLLGGEIKKAVAIIIPLATSAYTCLCFGVIIPNAALLPMVITTCVRDAFLPRGMVGGACGSLLSSAMTKGFATGLLSNEAGAGTSSFSHSALPESEAARAGVFGIIEVLFDTVFLCTLTGVTVLIGTAAQPSDKVGIDALSDIFSRYFGALGEPMLLSCILAFAISTVLCWYYYGSICTRWLFAQRSVAAIRVFTVVFFGAFMLGLLTNLPWLLPLADTLLLLLTLLTFVAIVKNRILLSQPRDLGKISNKGKTAKKHKKL